MRIISGRLKGRKFPDLYTSHVRPTTDRAKENLFNALNFKIDWRQTQTLDLFSGSGNMAFEFYSRGCPVVVSVDQQQKCVDYQKRLAEKWNVSDMTFIKAKANQYLNSATQRFHLIFADPPYAMKDLQHIPNQIIEAEVLHNEATIIVEHDHQVSFETHDFFEKKLKYGQTIFSIFKWFKLPTIHA